MEQAELEWVDTQQMKVIKLKINIYWKIKKANSCTNNTS